jgi:hypothetical protein
MLSVLQKNFLNAAEYNRKKTGRARGRLGLLPQPRVMSYSHSIVLGGFDEISKHTRFTPLTSLMMRFDMMPSSS